MKNGILFRSLRSLVVIVGAVGVAVSLYATREEPEKREIMDPAPMVDVIEVHPEPIAMSVEAYGTVTPRQSLRLTAEVPGRITWLSSKFLEGSLVNGHDILARIDPRSYALEVSSARVMVVQARTDLERLAKEIDNLRADRVLALANADLSARELARQEALSKEDFTSKTRLDQAKQRDIEARSRLQTIENNLGLTDCLMKQKQAGLDMAQLTLDKAALALERTEIKSDFLGFVTARTVEQGEFVGVGQPLGSIYRAGALDIEVSIPLEKLSWLDPVFASGEMPVADVTLSTGDKEKIWTARVTRIKAAIDQKTRTLPLVLEMTAPGDSSGGLDLPKPGTFVRCIVHGKVYDDIVVLPRHLLRPDDSLYVVENNTLASRPVTVLRKFQESVYISGGLKAGDHVISTPLPKAIDGMPVAIRNSVNQVGHR